LFKPVLSALAALTSAALSGPCETGHQAAQASEVASVGIDNAAAAAALWMTDFIINFSEQNIDRRPCAGPTPTGTTIRFPRAKRADLSGR
jgi:hypothetical protein